MSPKTKRATFWVALVLSVAVLTWFALVGSKQGLPRTTNSLQTALYFVAVYLIYLIGFRPTRKNAVLGATPMVVGYLTWLVIARWHF